MSSDFGAYLTSSKVNMRESPSVGRCKLARPFSVLLVRRDAAPRLQSESGVVWLALTLEGCPARPDFFQGQHARVEVAKRSLRFVRWNGETLPSGLR